MSNLSDKEEFYRNLPLEEAKQRYRECFVGDELVNKDEAALLLTNPELLKFMISKDRLRALAKQEEDLTLNGTSEKFLGEVYKPSYYWEMPDYYYPGIYSDMSEENVETTAKLLVRGMELPEELKVSSTVTRNEKVLNACGWFRNKYDKQEYFNKKFPSIKIFLNTEKQSVSLIKIDSEGNELENFEMPFALICGIFLRCRELDYVKPEELEVCEDSNWRYNQHWKFRR